MNQLNRTFDKVDYGDIYMSVRTTYCLAEEEGGGGRESRYIYQYVMHDW